MKNPSEIIQTMLEQWEYEHGINACDCRPEPENRGYVCAWCEARAYLDDKRALSLEFPRISRFEYAAATENTDGPKPRPILLREGDTVEAIATIERADKLRRLNAGDRATVVRVYQNSATDPQIIDLLVDSRSLGQFKIRDVVCSKNVPLRRVNNSMDDPKSEICAEIQEIMRERREQEAAGYLDSPGGLEHMGDVWRKLARWDRKLKDSVAPKPSGKNCAD